MMKSVKRSANTEFERQVAANRERADIQRLNKELQRKDSKDNVQNLNNSVAILTGKVS